MLLAIQSNKWLTVRASPYDNLVALDHIGIKTMKRLSISKHYVVGYVDYIINWPNANR